MIKILVAPPCKKEAYDEYDEKRGDTGYADRHGKLFRAVPEQDGLDGDFKIGDDDFNYNDNDFDNLPSVILLLHQDTRLQIFAWLGS